MSYYENETGNNRVPLEQVLHDMESYDKYISRDARDYYYLNYATESEKRLMDLQDLAVNMASCGFILVLFVGVVTNLLK